APLRLGERMLFNVSARPGPATLERAGRSIAGPLAPLVASLFRRFQNVVSNVSRRVRPGTRFFTLAPGVEHEPLHPAPAGPRPAVLAGHGIRPLRRPDAERSVRACRSDRGG